MFNHKVYFIETLTNTSVGSGDVSFGLVDNLIQKDPTTFLPVFNSSSLKGALRDHMKKALRNDIRTDAIKYIFGEGNDNPGQVKFYDARLLTLPLRSSIKVYYNCTSQSAITDYLETLIMFCNNTEVVELKEFIDNLDFEGKDFITFTTEGKFEIEDYDNHKVIDITDKKKLLENYLGEKIDNFAIFKDEIFSDICETSLPVIARNKIGEDGTSENLFYEEVLPRRSKLWFMIGFEEEFSEEKTKVEEFIKEIPDEKKTRVEEFIKSFEEKLTTDLIQFGANASIGYGVTQIKEITKIDEASHTEEVTDESKKD